jgi:hypothetical protein
MKGGRLLLFLLLAGVPSAAAGCSGCHHASAPVVDAAPVPSDTAPDVTVLQVIDSGDQSDGAAEAASKHGVNPVPPNKVMACCNALRAEAKKLGTNSVEGAQLMGFASQCDQAAKGNAPEFAGLFAILKSKNVPECKALP